MRAVIRDNSYWYEIYGEGEAVVLLHGFTGSTKTWSNFIESYQSKFKIITIDLPGHGKTECPNPISMETCCHDIHTILQRNQIHRFHLLGYSMGGRTALTYAMLYPEQLQSLILESASPGLRTEEERHNRIQSDEKLANKMEEEGVESFVNYWENIPLFESQKKLPQNIQQKIRNERLSQSAEGLAMSLRTMGTGRQPSWWSHLETFDKPVLLIVGELDHKYVAINSEMKKSLVNSEMIVVKNVGHAIHVEQPEFFGKMVEEFIFKVLNT